MEGGVVYHTCDSNDRHYAKASVAVLPCADSAADYVAEDVRQLLDFFDREGIKVHPREGAVAHRPQWEVEGWMIDWLRDAFSHYPKSYQLGWCSSFCFLYSGHGLSRDCTVSGVPKVCDGGGFTSFENIEERNAGKGDWYLGRGVGALSFETIVDNWKTYMGCCDGAQLVLVSDSCFSGEWGRKVKLIQGANIFVQSTSLSYAYGNIFVPVWLALQNTHLRTHWLKTYDSGSSTKLEHNVPRIDLNTSAAVTSHLGTPIHSINGFEGNRNFHFFTDNNFFWFCFENLRYPGCRTVSQVRGGNEEITEVMELIESSCDPIDWKFALSGNTYCKYYHSYMPLYWFEFSGEEWGVHVHYSGIWPNDTDEGKVTQVNFYKKGTRVTALLEQSHNDKWSVVTNWTRKTLAYVKTVSKVAEWECNREKKSFRGKHRAFFELNDVIDFINRQGIDRCKIVESDIEKTTI